MGLWFAEQNVEYVKTCTFRNAEMLGLWFAEQNVGTLKQCTFRNSGTPVRRTKHRKYRNIHFRIFWDSCAQNKTSEISNTALLDILGLLCAQQNARHLNICTFRISGTLARRTKRQKYKKCTFKNYGTPGSRILDPGSWIKDP